MCNYPLQLVKNGREFSVPCGRCLGCRIERRDTWRRRIVDEMHQSKCSASFVTLTYNEESLPFVRDDLPTLRKEHLIGFMKRMRERLRRARGSRPYFRYFGVGEHGGIGNRPHYHAILLGVDPFHHLNLITDCWPFGFVDAKGVTRGRIKYVVDYIEKEPYLGSSAKEHYAPAEPPFSIVSKGLGLNFLKVNSKLLREHGYYRDGRQVKMPRYYQKKLKIVSSDSGLPHIEEQELAVSSGYIGRAEMLSASLHAREQELLSKLNLKGKI